MEIQDFLLKMVKVGKEFFETLERLISQEKQEPSKSVSPTRFTADEIRELSKRIGSQMELAKLLKVSSGTVNRWITDRSQPRHQHLIKMAELVEKYPPFKPSGKLAKSIESTKKTTEYHPITSEYIIKLAKGVGSQRRLSEMLDVHHVSVNKWVKGLSRPRLKLMPKLKEIEEKIIKGIITPIRKAPRSKAPVKSIKGKKSKPGRKASAKKA